MANFAMIFPGQGSQSSGMLGDLAKKFVIIKKTFLESSDILGYDLWNFLQNASETELNKTSKTQPIVLSTSVSIFRIWQEINGKMPQFMAGHSLGEYSALVCSGVLDFQEAIKLVELRGKLMQKVFPKGKGGMYAIIGLDNESVSKICYDISKNKTVSPANFNAPNQIVIAGNKKDVEKAALLCKYAGAKYIIPLSISVPSHCMLMKPAAKKLEKALKKIKFHNPKIPIVNNVDVKIEFCINKIKNALVRQMYSPVRWVEIIQFLSKRKISNFIEIGPGKILTKLTKRINNKINVIAINDINSLKIASITH
ncbi:MAG: ACP S-malonyltransferase [Arsenophonus sp.]|nr:MAG: ACP S-malonyltransferase [Arsenophonus sp.]